MKSGFVRTRTHPAILLVAVVLLGALLAIGSQRASAATTRTWLGTSGANWNNTANWSPAGTPVDGDSLIFPAAATQKDVYNNIPGLELASLQFAGGYVVDGLGFTVDTAITVDLAGTEDVVTSAPITLGGAATITVTDSHFLVLGPLVLGAHTVTFSGDGQSEITTGAAGTGSVVVAKDATLLVGGLASYTGATIVSGGALVMDGGSISTSSTVTLLDGARFGGVGVSGPLSFAGSLLYPGIFTPLTPGPISAPSLSLNGTSTARFHLAGTVFPGDYDQVAVTGPVALGGAQLDLLWDLEPVVGEQFHLITGATSLTGTFADLPEGAIFTSLGRRFSISYKVAPGHDVVITRLPAAPADLSVALEASSSTVAPGGAVTFTTTVTNHGPSDAPSVAVSNDLPPGLSFEAVSAPAGFSCATPTAGAPGQVKCYSRTVAAGESVTFEVVARASTTASGPATTFAAVSSSADETASADNSTSATITIGQGTAYPYRVYAPNVTRE